MSWYSPYAFWKARQIALVPADTTPTPTATSATPTSVDVGGGITVVIAGTGFMAAKPRPDVGTSFVLNVYFGLVLATSFVVDSATQITAIAAAGTAGSAPVVVNTSGGCAIVPGAFTYTDDLLTEAGLGLLDETGVAIEAET
jgi:hypothetical protein